MTPIRRWLEAHDPGLWTLRGAVCGTVAVAVACAICFFWGDREQAGVAYLAAFLATGLDAPDRLSARLRRLFVGGALITAVTWLAPVCSPYPLLLGACVVVLSVTAVAVSEVAPAWRAVATAVLVMFVGMIGVADDVITPARWAAVGSFVAIVSTLTLWPVWRDSPSWYELGGLMKGLARVLDTARVRLQGDDHEKASHEANLNAFLAALRRALGSALVRARAVKSQSRGHRALVGFARVARSLLSRSSATEGVRTVMSERGRAENVRHLLDDAYHATSAWLAACGLRLQQVLHEDVVPLDAVKAASDRAVVEIGALARRVLKGPPDRAVDDEVLVAIETERLLDGVRIIAHGVETDDWATGDAGLSAAIPWRLWETGRSVWQHHAFSFDSPSLIHGLRLGVAGLIAIALANLLGLERAYWTSVTVATALQGNFSDTLRDTARKGAAILAGCAFALFLLQAHLSNAASLAVLVLLVFLSGVGPLLAEGLDVLFTTSVVVMMIVTIGGVDALSLVEVRVENMALGSVVVLFCIMCLWPRWSRTHLPSALESALRAVRGCAGVFVGVDRQGDIALAFDKVMGRAYLSLDNASQMLQNAIRDPYGRAGDVDAWLAILLSANRLFGIYYALSVHLSQCDLPHDLHAISDLARRTTDEIDLALARLAGESGAATPPPPFTLDFPRFHERLVQSLSRDVTQPRYADHVALFLEWRALVWELEHLRHNVERIVGPDAGARSSTATVSAAATCDDGVSTAR